MEYICPNCKKPIYDDDALLCLYCGESLRRSMQKTGNTKFSSCGIILSIIVAVVIIAFIILQVF